MTWFRKILLLLKLKSITRDDILVWKNSCNLMMLKFALKNGKYRERIEAIKVIRELQLVALIPELLLVAKDDIEVVSNEAISAIKILDVKNLYSSRLVKFQKMWEIRNKPSKFKTRRPNPINRKDRMKRLEIVREQLKKSIR